ncbi:MAG TPA: DNA alkylation repair protein, partial [Longilinea sp.]|nr:DNA alkylation repair protein [Longilinea sp.]
QTYSSDDPAVTAHALKKYWLEFEPNQGINLIKAEQRRHFEAAGTPTPVLKAIGDEIAKWARKDVNGFLPLVQLLWDEYGREGRVIALIPLGAMELTDPPRFVPLLKEMCKECNSWEEADRLAMDALEPIVRKNPDQWLTRLEEWLDDKNKWVRRAAITVIARIPMKHPGYTRQCLVYAERLLLDTELDVKRAVSFDVRLCAKVDPKLVYTFLEKHVPGPDPASVWVLSDVIKSMDRKVLPLLSPLLARFQQWRDAPGITAKDQRTLDSAIKVLQVA